MRLILFLLALPAFAAQGLVYSGSAGQATVTLPNAAPFTSIGNIRCEMGLSNYSTSGFHKPFTVGLLGIIDVVAFGTTFRIGVTRGGQYQYSELDTTGYGHFIIRFQQPISGSNPTLANGYTYIEKWSGDGSGYTVSAVPMASSATANIGGLQLALSDTASGGSAMPAGVRIEFLRCYTSLLPLRSSPPANVVSTPGDLFSYAFDGNLNDASGNGINLTGSGSYNTTTEYAPIAVIATPSVGRAGSSLSLSATGSFSSRGTDGLPASYRWRVTSGPKRAYFSAATTATPSLRLPVSGSYTVQMEAIDSEGTISSPVTATVGAVATDSSGRVITGNSTLDELLLPMTRQGAGPWPWFEDTAQQAADVLLTKIPATRSLDTTLAGTVSVTTNSATVTGSGTSFLSTFNCNSTDYITIHYVLSDGSTGRRTEQVAGCASNTSLTLGNAWYREGVANGVTYTGYAYARTTDAELIQWTGGSDNLNYYDAVTGLYRMYYRTGLAKYRTAARDLAARSWLYPIDKGVSCVDSANATCANPRQQQLQGIVAWFIDTNQDEAQWDFLAALINRRMITAYGYPTGIYDLREQGYVYWTICLLAKYHPNPTTRASFATLATQGYEYYRDQQYADGSWRWSLDELGYSGNGMLPWHAFAVLQGLRVYYDHLATNLEKPDVLGVITDAANFLEDQAKSESGGIRYAVGYTLCEGGAACNTCNWSGGTISCQGNDTSTGPFSANTFVGNRPENQPLSWLWGWLYKTTGNSTWLAKGDVNFGKTYGGGGGGPSDDGGRGTLNDPLTDGNTLAKEWAEAMGSGAATAHLAYRLGSVAAEDLVTITRHVKLGAGQKMRLTLTKPTGEEVTSSICSSSPCTVQADRRMGDHLIRVDRLNSSDVVISRGRDQRVRMQ
jgi:hypothetical protein